MISRAAMWQGDPKAFFDALAAGDIVWLDDEDDRIIICAWEAIQ
jgi:hypothetical protein